MSKVIYEKDGKSLDELDWKPGDVVGFDNTESANSFPYPFILTLPEQIFRGYKGNSPNSMRIVQCRDESTIESWTLVTKKKVFGLWPLNQREERLKIEEIGIEENPDFVYSAEVSLSGIDSIRDYFRNTKGFEIYSESLDFGKLVIETKKAGFVSRLLEKFSLTDKIRFE